MDDKNPIICPTCQKRFDTIRGLSVHWTSHCEPKKKTHTHTIQDSHLRASKCILPDLLPHIIITKN